MSQPQALACGGRERPATQQVANGREPSVARTQGGPIVEPIGSTEDKLQGERLAAVTGDLLSKQVSRGGDGSQPQPRQSATTSYRWTSRRAGAWNQSSSPPAARSRTSRAPWLGRRVPSGTRVRCTADPP